MTTLTLGGTLQFTPHASRHIGLVSDNEATLFEMEDLAYACSDRPVSSVSQLQ